MLENVIEDVVGRTCSKRCNSLEQHRTFCCFFTFISQYVMSLAVVVVLWRSYDIDGCFINKLKDEIRSLVCSVFNTTFGFGIID